MLKYYHYAIIYFQCKDKRCRFLVAVDHMPWYSCCQQVNKLGRKEANKKLQFYSK